MNSNIENKGNLQASIGAELEALKSFWRGYGKRLDFEKKESGPGDLDDMRALCWGWYKAPDGRYYDIIEDPSVPEEDFRPEIVAYNSQLKEMFADPAYQERQRSFSLRQMGRNLRRF